jgi:hypothetical protein
MLGRSNEDSSSIGGAIDADLRSVVDRAGLLNIPLVGTIRVSGVRYADRPEGVDQRVGSTVPRAACRSGSLGASACSSRAWRRARRASLVDSLLTLVAVLMCAGGPPVVGSFRALELRRSPGVIIDRRDFYDLLLGGDRLADRLLHSSNVVHVGPLGTQIGFIGRVNKPAVIKLKTGQTVSDSLRIVGAFTSVADKTRLVLERLSEHNERRIAQLNLRRGTSAPLRHCEVVRAPRAVDMVVLTQRHANACASRPRWSGPASTCCRRAAACAIQCWQ